MNFKKKKKKKDAKQEICSNLKKTIMLTGSRVGAVVRALASHPNMARARFLPSAMCGLSLLLFLACSKGFLQVL